MQNKVRILHKLTGIILLGIFVLGCNPKKPAEQPANTATEVETAESQMILVQEIVSENITGKWYRNYLFNDAELTINDKEFSINALGMANLGFIEGTIIKIEDGRYISNIVDELNNEKSTIIFLYNTDCIEVIVEGVQIGAGNRVFYDGKYEKEAMTAEEYIDKGLEHIIGDSYNKIIVKELLGDDLEYFITCFGIRYVEILGNRIIIEGFMPGIAPWQNGIIKIENNNLYIMITNSREDILKYYTNDFFNNDIPNEFRDWVNFDMEKEMIKKILE